MKKIIFILFLWPVFAQAQKTSFPMLVDTISLGKANGGTSINGHLWLPGLGSNPGGFLYQKPDKSYGLAIIYPDNVSGFGTRVQTMINSTLATTSVFDTRYKNINANTYWGSILEKPVFGKVATSNKYADLDGLPVVPAPVDLSPYLTKTDAGNTYQAKGDYLANGALNGYATQNYVNSQGFLTSAPVTSVFNRTGAIAANQIDYQAFYPLLSGAYDNPTWINSLAGTKVTGLGNGAFLNASMDSRATSLVQRGNTGSIVVNEIDASYLRAVFPIETALLPNSILGVYSEPGMKSAARVFPLSTIAQSLQLGTMSKQDTSRFIKREYLQDMASFNRTGQFTGSSTDPANPLAGLGSTGIGVSVLSMFEGPNNGSQLILSNGYNTQTHRYFDAYGSMFANGALHITHFLLDNNFRDYVYSKGYIDTAFNNLTLPYSRVTGAPNIPVTSVFNRTGAIGASATDYAPFYPQFSGSYPNPSWIPSYDYNKLTNKPPIYTPLPNTSTVYAFKAEVTVPAGQTVISIPHTLPNIGNFSVVVITPGRNAAGTNFQGATIDGTNIYLWYNQPGTPALSAAEINLFVYPIAP